MTKCLFYKFTQKDVRSYFSIQNKTKYTMDPEINLLTLPHMGDFEQHHKWGGGHKVPHPIF